MERLVNIMLRRSDFAHAQALEQARIEKGRFIK
jgi:hypothetical protein